MDEEQQRAIDPQTLLYENLTMVNHVVRKVWRSARLQHSPDVDDFVSTVLVALMENDYAILRKWEGRGSLAGYVSVVSRRMLADRLDRQRGRWRPSTEALRGGKAGVLLEKLLFRDGCSFEEAVSRARKIEPARSVAELTALAARFPKREPRLSSVRLDAVAEASMPAPDQADARVLDAEARRLAQRAGEVIRGAVASWPDEEATIFRLRFGSSMTIAEISRSLEVPQRALYRRVEALVVCLRTELLHAGLDAAVLDGVFGEASQEMDFGLEDPRT